MNKQEQREWIEKGKMFKAFSKLGYNVCKIDAPIDEYKEQYFNEVLGIDDVEVIEIKLDDDVWTELYKISDFEDKIVDEIVNEYLELYLEELRVEEEKRAADLKALVEQLKYEEEQLKKERKASELKSKLEEEKKKVPKGYRLLNNLETIQDGDEFYHAYLGQWTKNGSIDIGKLYDESKYFPIRRLI